MIVDPVKLAQIIADTIDGQTPEVAAELTERLRAGECEVWAPPGAEWATVVVADAEIARVHWTRLVGAGDNPGSN